MKSNREENLTARIYEERKQRSPGTTYRIEKRRPTEEEAAGEYCYDLIVGQDGEICRLCDVARSEGLAARLLKIFREGGVTPLEAPYILEDLMVDKDLID